MVSPFVVVKEHLIKEIREKELVDDEGQIRNVNEWISLINSVPVAVWVGQYRDERDEIVLLSKPLIDILELESEVIGSEHIFTILSSLDTSFIVNLHSKQSNYSLGTFPEGGMNTLFEGEDGKIHEFNNYSFPLIYKNIYKNLYFHLFCKPEKMRLLQAYFLYDFFNLTKRQREVLDLMVFGRDKAEVSEELGISPRTTEKHFKIILDHANVDSQQEFINSLL